MQIDYPVCLRQRIDYLLPRLRAIAPRLMHDLVLVLFWIAQVARRNDYQLLSVFEQIRNVCLSSLLQVYLLYLLINKKESYLKHPI
jgi:hypothetical protein